ncbi:cyclophilin-like domain-containing protein [Globomyces pollinis-pini]|nr:cyclophilin-like domain-containing protein [Globomyces pollinis-pini]
MSKAFLDLTLGDTKEFEKQEVQFNNAILYLAKIHESYHLPSNIMDLDDTQKELIQELHSNSPFAAETIRLESPVDIGIGRIVVELFDTLTPKTVHNFKSLCTGELGLSKSTKKPLHFKSTPIHRIVKNFIAQGGDITRFDGSGGDSVYGGKFNDEKEGLKLKFSKGSLGMANSGKNSNTSQFFFCLDDSQSKKLNGKYVCFGKVIEGLDILEKLNSVGTEDGTPIDEVLVVNCGLL